MSPPFARLLLLVAFGATTALGCKAQIGDECQISTDCSPAGDRLCDITAPGGYCTVYNCEPGTCPADESLCVQFGSQRSIRPECIDYQSPSPYARAFCMATCESNDDCRPEYRCESLSGDNPWGALLIDRDRGGRACMVPRSPTDLPALPEDAAGNVCQAGLSTGGTGAGGTGTGGTGVGGSGAAAGTGDGGAAGEPGGGQSAGGQSGAAG